MQTSPSHREIMSASTQCSYHRRMGRGPRNHFRHFSNRNWEYNVLHTIRNKTETKRIGSIYRRGSRKDQQLHFAHFRDLLLFFLLFMAELPGETGTAQLATAGPWVPQGAEWQKQIPQPSPGHPLCHPLCQSCLMGALKHTGLRALYHLPWGGPAKAQVGLPGSLCG